MAKCRICNAAHAACGPATTVVPVDLRVTTQEGRIMPLKRYRTTERVGRSDVETIVKLTEEQAEALGLEEYQKPDSKPAKKPATKSASATKTAKGTGAPKAAAKPANKAAPAPATKPAPPAAEKPAPAAPAAPPAPESPESGVEAASDPSASE